MKTLDELLELDEPHGTFHDAELIELVMDRPRGTVRAIMELCVGDPESPSSEERERRRVGQLELGSLLFWVEDPALPTPDSAALPGTWFTAEGPLTEATTEIGRQLSGRYSGGDVWAWYLYFSDTNRFVYWAAREATFRWSSSARPAA